MQDILNILSQIIHICVTIRVCDDAEVENTRNNEFGSQRFLNLVPFGKLSEPNVPLQI